MGITTSLYEFDGASRSLLLLLHTLEVCAIQEEKKLMLKSDKQPMCAFLNTILCMYVGCTHSLTHSDRGAKSSIRSAADYPLCRLRTFDQRSQPPGRPRLNRRMYQQSKDDSAPILTGNGA